MLLSFIIPTRNRPELLEQTLRSLGRLDPLVTGPSEVIVVDNASSEPVRIQSRLPNGIAARVVRLDNNHHTAARNIGAQQASGQWLVMLDDDSSPLPCQMAAVLTRMSNEVAAVGGEILLASGQRESGGLPEVIVGCGCAIRREVFLEIDGYDASLGYYAEEYDLCARLIAGGKRILHTRSLRFEHRKATRGRDMNEILFRLVRNNAWIMQRYAPLEFRPHEIDAILQRYRTIAMKEDAIHGYERGIAALADTLDEQVEAALSSEHWDRFTGRAAARDRLGRVFRSRPEPVRLVGPPNPKGGSIVAEELERLGCTLVQDPHAAGVISTLSPGPMLDAADADAGAICPWAFERV